MNIGHYTKIIGLIDSITSNITAYELFSETGNGVSDKWLIAARDNARELVDLFPEIENELELCFINNGEEVFSKYCKILKEKLEKAAIGAPLESIKNPIFLQDFQVVHNDPSINNLKQLKLSTEILIYYTKFKKGGPEVELFTDIDYIGFFSFGVLILCLLKVKEKEVELIKLTTKNNQKADEDQIPNNLYSLSGVPEKLLFLKHTGIYSYLLSRYPKRATVSKVISYLISSEKEEKPTARYIATLFGGLEFPERKDNTPHTKEAIENAIDALSDIKEDVTELQAVLSRFYKG